MENQQVITQPDNSAYCSFYAILNLYRSLQLPPPDLPKMFAIDPLGARTASQPLIGVWRMLCLLGFPGLCYMGVVPVGATLREALAAHVNQGDSLLLYLIADWQGHRYEHLAVLEHCYPDGISMYCSVMGKLFAPYAMLSQERLEEDDLPVVDVRLANQRVTMPFGIVPTYLAVSPFKEKRRSTDSLLTISINGGNGNGIHAQA